jgi:hypothetical protein
VGSVRDRDVQHHHGKQQKFIHIYRLTTTTFDAAGSDFVYWRCSVLLDRLLKNLSESFDGAQDERRGFDIVDDFRSC